MMRSFLTTPRPATPVNSTITATLPPADACTNDGSLYTPDIQYTASQPDNEIFTGYCSDISENELLPEDEEVENQADDECESQTSLATAIATSRSAHSESSSTFRVREPLPLKKRKLVVPIRVERKKVRDERQLQLTKALTDLEKLIKSKKELFHGGQAGLQAYRARAIKSYLHMVVHNRRKGIEASEMAAESQGFAAKWGGRLVRVWVQKWVKDRILPSSSKGNHGKSFSLLNDPAIRAELRSYVRTDKWAMNPSKLVEFSQNKMVPDAAKKYLQHIVDVEMPQGLKRYMEVELFPRIQLRVGRGVSLSTARRILHLEGFRYTEHKKGLYYDGHERPDVVQYRQDEFLPQMAEHQQRLVEYIVGEVDKELEKTPLNFVERRLVLCAHDEMTAQANDGLKKSWILNGEQPLKKKGAGRGIHQSDVICSTIGWLKEASQTLEYGKNYEGYWTGELFVKQVSVAIGIKEHWLILF